MEVASIGASSDTMAIPPFGSGLLVFYALGPQGEAVPGAVMHFSIVDEADTPGSGGAQLSFSSALTAGDGAVALQVIAGQGASGQKLEFKVEASTGEVLLPIPIFVTTSPLATVEITPVFPDQSPSDNDLVSKTYIYFYDSASCASVSRAHPVPPLRQVPSLSRDDPTATFTSVATVGVHAVLGLAVDAHEGVVAEGCMDLFGASLSADQPMRVLLPLTRLYPSPVGSFRAVSQFSFAAPLLGTVSAQNIWKELSDDACDPARLWLDCTIDALSGTSAEDPLDCQPVAGGEGDLGASLAALRAPPDASTPCASHFDANGNPTLDAKVYALFPTGSLDAFQLTTLPDELGNALTSLTVNSTLTVTATDSKNAFNIEHDLTALALPNAALHHPLIAMTALAAPVSRDAFVSGESEAGKLVISPHSFTLELGSAARFTFAASSLAPRLSSLAPGSDVADVGVFIEALLKSATRSQDGTMLRGCDALDSLLCAEVQQAPGCVSAACLSGLQALIQRLDASFSALDGRDLDFFLSGSAPIVDRDGDGQADALGSKAPSSSSPSPGLGLWSATFKSRTGTTDVLGCPWTADREDAPIR